MSSRRLALVKICPSCNREFHPFRKESVTCSHKCRAIREWRLKPKNFMMVEANKANRARILAQLAESVEGLTLVEAYQKGHLRGYRTGYQAATRYQRKWA